MAAIDEVAQVGPPEILQTAEQRCRFPSYVVLRWFFTGRRYSRLFWRYFLLLHAFRPQRQGNLLAGKCWNPVLL